MPEAQIKRDETEMDWFEKLTGFAESTGVAGYEMTRQRLEVDGRRLKSRVNACSYGVGALELVSLEELLGRARSAPAVGGRCSLRIVSGDVRKLHAAPEYEGALFQVASQFNLLEMVSQRVTPEDGVTRYTGDPTQGPACAIAAGAATIYRNYFAFVGDRIGQTKDKQLDGFAELGAAVARALGKTPETLWTMQNGYAMFTRNGADLMSGHVRALDDGARDTLRELLRIGVHWDVEVTDARVSPGPLVSQAFCSALPVSYNNAAGTRGTDWQTLATLVLEAAYEATLWAAVINAQRGSSKTVLLTLLGGGVFGNDFSWIQAAMQRAIEEVEFHGLDIVIVSYGEPSAELQRWVTNLNACFVEVEAAPDRSLNDSLGGGLSDGNEVVSDLDSQYRESSKCEWRECSQPSGWGRFPYLLSNEELTLDNVPAANESWDSILWFALTIDGYVVPDQQKFRDLHCVLDPVRKPSLTELRTALFHFQRGWRWNGGEPLEGITMALVHRVVGEIRQLVADRKFD